MLAHLALANECALPPDAEVRARLAAIAAAMSACVDRGIASGGILPGGLKVRRRAPAIHAKLLVRQERALRDPLSVIDWVNLWALAVNEYNAPGGRVITAPTNVAADIVSALMRYYERSAPDAGPMASFGSCWWRARSDHCSRKTPRFPVPRSGVRAKSALPVRWRRLG